MEGRGPRACNFFSRAGAGWGTGAMLLALGGCVAARADVPREEQRPCAVNVVPITWTTPGDERTGELGGMTVPVELDGRMAWLAIDTGSALTFLHLGEDGPEYEPYAGTVRIGCETLELPGRGGLPVEDPDIVGVLGATFFTDVPSVFDPVSATITRHREGGLPPPDPRETQLAYEDVLGHVLVRLEADGTPLRLMWDTGSPHLLWVGARGRPGDERAVAQDVLGGRFPMYVGRAEVGVAGEPTRPMTVLRAPRFPYFEGTVEALGGDLQGLAGQSVFGRRRMSFDPLRRVIRLGPAEGSGP